MADDDKGKFNNGARQGSVKELILRAEKNAKRTIVPAVPLPPNVRQSVKKAAVVVKTKKVSVKEDIDLSKFSDNSLQSKLPHAISVHYKRKKAQLEYLRNQKKLQKEYEKKVRELHKSFARNESSIVHTFPATKTAAEKAKLKVIEKLKKEIAEEKDEELKKKLENELKLQEKDLPELRSDTEKEMASLKGVWMSINASHWDMLLSSNHGKQTYGYNARQYDVFEAIRRNDDAEVAKGIGSTNKHSGRKVQSGSAAFWSLGQIASDENSLNEIKHKEKSRLNSIARTVLKLAGVEDNKTNKDKVLKILKKDGWKQIRKAVDSFGKTLTPKQNENLLKEEVKLNQVIVARVDSVDRIGEKARLVMILDRNGRPCVGGLPPSQTTQLVKPRKTQTPPPLVNVPTRTLADMVIELPLLANALNIAEPTDTADAEVSGSDDDYDETTDGNEEDNDEEDEEEEDEGEGEDEGQVVEEGETGETAVNEEEVQETAVVEEEEEHIDGYCTTEQSFGGREYNLSIGDLLSVDDITLVDEDMKAYFKNRYNTFVPHITYQRIAGFQVFNNNLNKDQNENRRRRDRYDDAGDFQIVDIGVKLDLEPLMPLQDYDQEWRNGTLYSLRHKRDGPVRFVGFNETGFGFMEDRPIDMHVQTLKDPEGNVTGVNIMHMTLFDTNEQICFDTLYMKDDEDMETNKKWKSFGKDAIGNRLAYRIVAQKGKIQAILYPFQGKVQEAKLNMKDVSDMKEGDLVNIVTEGQTTRRIGRVKLMPTGMVVGTVQDEKKSSFPATPFLEMIRMRQRVFAEMRGLIDLEILCEDNQLVKESREEAWPDRKSVV